MPFSISTFLQLTDTPTSYIADKWVKVNSAGDALELTNPPTGGSGGTVQGTDHTYDIQAADNFLGGSLNEHGEYSVDLQTARTLPTHISDGRGAVLVGGTSNRAGGDYSMVVGCSNCNIWRPDLMTQVSGYLYYWNRCTSAMSAKDAEFAWVDGTSIDDVQYYGYQNEYLVCPEALAPHVTGAQYETGAQFTRAMGGAPAVDIPLSDVRSLCKRWSTDSGSGRFYRNQRIDVSVGVVLGPYSPDTAAWRTKYLSQPTHDLYLLDANTGSLQRVLFMPLNTVWHVRLRCVAIENLTGVTAVWDKMAVVVNEASGIQIVALKNTDTGEDRLVDAGDDEGQGYLVAGNVADESLSELFLAIEVSQTTRELLLRANTMGLASAMFMADLEILEMGFPVEDSTSGASGSS